MDYWDISTDDFVHALRAEKLWRACLATDPGDGTLRASHPSLEELARRVAGEARDFRGHEACFLEIGRESGHLLGAFVHKTVRGQAAGGVRFWAYRTLGDMIRDGLRLSRAMGCKNALAGIWWGGGKGVIARRGGADHRDPALRAAVYRDYGRFVSGIRGCYVTAEDVGTRPEDMAWIFRTTRFTTCIPECVGGSGNPGILTARGVVVAMEAALHHLGKGTLEGKTVAMQGLGNVATAMIGDLLARRVERVVATDIDESAVESARERFAGMPVGIRHVDADDTSIFSERCDVFAPNAVGAVLRPETIARLRAEVVCGAANNQLEDPARDGPALEARNILYVPDFLANRMGIVNCANEQYGVIAGDPVVERHLDREAPEGIYQRCLDVCRRAGKSGRSTAEEAERLADELSNEPHPVWPNRGRQIIDALVRGGWCRAEPAAIDPSGGHS